MKINLNKSTKRALSLVLALAVAIGSLFTANIGVNISADAATLNIKYWSGETTAPKANSDGSYTINTPEELAYIVGNGDKYEIGTNFKVADGIDAFIMQPSSIIVDSDNNGVLDIMECNNYTETKTFFDKLSGEIPWVTGNSSKPFRSNFNGNGVEIYGLYSASNTYAALFPYVGGAYAYEMTDDWSVGSVFENFAVRNSCLTGQRVGAIIAYETTPNDKVCNIQDCGSYNKSADDHSAYKGRITIQKCEITNCYIESTRTAAANGSENVGVMIGAHAWGDVAYGHHITDCIVYGNYAFNTNNGTKIQRGLFGGISGAVSNSNVYKEKYPGYCQYSNIITIDAAPGMVGGSSGYNCCSAELYSKVYTNVTKSPSSASDKTSWNYAINYNSSQVTILESADAAKGSLGKLAMDLDWATDEEDGTWYAIDGEYPTLFKPEGWKDCETIKPWDGTAAESFAADAEGNYGDGTAKKPYLIETPEQLFAMVKTGGKVDGTPAYYKVKDGVKNLYLSKAISGGYAAAKACTDYHNWNTDTWTVFEGNFDGNGVTIRGMISKSTNNNKYVGLVHVFSEDAVVKNVNFDTCYAHNSSTANAALLASNVIGFQDENKDGVSTNCKNCKTYNYATNSGYCEKHYNNKDNNADGVITDCGGTSCVHSGDSVKCEVHNGGGKDGYNLIYNVSVRNSSIQSKGNSQCAGLVVSYNGYADMLQFVNCLYDGYSCELGNGETGANANAGMAAFSWGLNNAMASGCVSLNAPVFSNRSGTDINYNDYTTGNKSGHPVYMYNCYTDVAENIDTTVVELVDENGASVITDDYDYINNMPLLDWANGWYVATDANGRKVPMPRVRTAADVTATWDTGETVLHYNRWLSVADGGTGTAPYNGKNGRFEKFVGSGTEADPYIISTPLELARAIGVGGTKLNNKLHFKLACDIDLSDMPWLNAVGTRPTKASSTSYDRVYTYVPFEGVLDGDGHTITGLYAVNGNTAELSYGTYSNAAGLIPVLASGGVVKNLHIRNSYAGSGTGYAGALVGEAQPDSTISGCSVENCIVVSNGTDNDYHMIGSAGGKIENLYYVAGNNSTTTNKTVYVNASGAVVEPDAIDLESGIWYKGGLEGSMPQLVNRAAAMTETDVSGLGDADYNAADLSSLRNKLLRKSAYKYIYGDVNRDGQINSTDLVILRRAMVDDYEDLEDGFWRNLELGKVAIYYSENDTQDMARKLELYFESEVPGLDMMKYATSDDTVTDSSLTSEDIKAAPTENAVILRQGDPTKVAYNTYSVTYTEDKNLVEIYGGSFTAVEQAVINFMVNSSRATDNIYQIANGDILNEKLSDKKIVLSGEDADSLVTLNTTTTESSYKQKVTVGGVDYYYAWGDEFEGVSDTISSDNWTMSSYRGENEDGTTSMYTNQENANLEDLKTLWVCQDGRLSIWRGVNTDALTSSINGYNAYEWGYKGLSLGTSGKNDWGKDLDADDAYIDPGLITTKNSMLFKQGYIEMEASLPSDGHAFPAWWFLTYSGDRNNTTIANSLYGKVFKENSNWVNTNTGNFIPGDLSTYKYQLPSAHLELDIVEPMQTVYNGTSTTAYKYPIGSNNAYKKDIDTFNHYKRDFSVTVHKIYNENADSDNLYIINWANSSLAKTIARADFTTSSSAGSWIHRYNGSNYFDANGSVYQGYQLGSTWYNSGTEVGASYNMARKMTGTVKYGFSWSVDVTAGEYDLKIYVDLDGNGIMADSEMVMAINESTGHESKYSTDYIYSQGKNADAEIWNQYAYMLLDNCFYTANQGDGVQYTDLLSQETTGDADFSQYVPFSGNKVYENYKIKDKTTFDINYVRVYQQDGMRDIVTRDTEEFNNGNHFGYGK